MRSNSRECSGRDMARVGARLWIGAGLLALSAPGGAALAGDGSLEAAFERERAALLPADETPSKLAWTLTAELWVPKVDGDFTLQGTPTDISVGLGSGEDDDYAVALHVRAQLTIDRVLLFLDNSAAAAHEDRAMLGPSLGEMDLTIAWFEFGAGYRLIDAPAGGEGAKLPGFTLDALVGGRVTRLRAEFDPDFAPKLKNDHTWVEPYVGGQLYWRPADHLAVRVAGDVGGFGAGSNLSWQAAASVGYTFHLSRFPLTVYGGYRALGQDFDVDSGEDLSGWSGVVQGPVAGVTFEF